MAFGSHGGRSHHRPRHSKRSCPASPIARAASGNCRRRKSRGLRTPYRCRKVNDTSANRYSPSVAGEPMVRKKTTSELEQAEIKLQSLLEKRDVLNAEAQEMRQQTASLTLSKENELIDELKESMKRLKVLEGLKSDQDKIAKEVRDLDGGITELFEAAEKEHAAAVVASGKARAVHEETVGLSRQIAALVSEGNEKHDGYLAARGKADEVHAKVVEMREKVLSIKGAARAEVREARDLLRQQNRSVRAALLDEKKLEASADAALKALLEKGKGEIGRSRRSSSRAAKARSSSL